MLSDLLLLAIAVILFGILIAMKAGFNQVIAGLQSIQSDISASRHEP
jgi:hypothetical protein